MKLYPERALERATKRPRPPPWRDTGSDSGGMAKKINRIQAAEIIGVTPPPDVTLAASLWRGHMGEKGGRPES